MGEDESEVRIPADAPVGPVLSFESPQLSARGMLRSGAVVGVIALVANGCNVIFHFATARLMGPEEYSLLTSMFAVFIIGAVPLSAIQATIVREMASLLRHGDERGAGLVMRAGIRTVLRAGLIGIAVAVVLFFPFVEILHVGRPLPVLAVIVAFIAQMPGPVVAGALQASERFYVLSWAAVLQSTAKLAAGVGLAALGFGASAVTFGFALATALSVAVMVRVLRPYLRVSHGHQLPARRIIGRYTLGAAVALGFHTVLISTDLLWARGGLGGEQAGLYAAASVATSVLLLIPIGINTVLFSRVTKLSGSSGERGHLLVGLGWVASLAVPCIVMLAAFPTQLLHLGFGSQYDAAAPWLWPLGIAMAFYALGIVFLNHLLALGRTTVAFLMIGVVVTQQLLFVFFHHSGPQIIGVQIVSSIVVVVGCFVYLEVTTARRAAPEPVA